jgi:two-component system, NtrC family, nitrogen regulation sensor histidine kinase NtrY
MKRLYEVKLQQQSIEVILPEITDDEILVQADQKQLEQVLINVIKNSIESIQNNGEINIELLKNEKEIVLRINDTGEGISNESQHNIFTPFYTTKSDGQGIGLMLTREILDAHQFDFSLYNRKEKGACFEINFKTN